MGNVFMMGHGARRRKAAIAEASIFDKAFARKANSFLNRFTPEGYRAFNKRNTNLDSAGKIKSEDF